MEEVKFANFKIVLNDIFGKDSAKHLRDKNCRKGNMVTVLIPYSCVTLLLSFFRTLNQVL